MTFIEKYEDGSGEVILLEESGDIELHETLDAVFTGMLYDMIWTLEAGDRTQLTPELNALIDRIGKERNIQVTL